MRPTKIRPSTRLRRSRGMASSTGPLRLGIINWSYTIPLLRRSRVDGLIFVGLIAILIYNNITQHGTPITTWLLSPGRCASA
jgi:hypothetical protein